MSRAIAVGTVRFWNAAEGWGVVDSPDTPGGCWVDASALRVHGYLGLEVGQRVAFRPVEAREDARDGCSWRAVTLTTGIAAEQLLRGLEATAQREAAAADDDGYGWG